jgi:hypothetical protein
VSAELVSLDWQGLVFVSIIALVVVIGMGLVYRAIRAEARPHFRRTRVGVFWERDVDPSEQTGWPTFDDETTREFPSTPPKPKERS